MQEPICQPVIRSKRGHPNISNERRVTLEEGNHSTGPQVSEFLHDGQARGECGVTRISLRTRCGAHFARYPSAAPAVPRRTSTKSPRLRPRRAERFQPKTTPQPASDRDRVRRPEECDEPDQVGGPWGQYVGGSHVRFAPLVATMTPTIDPSTRPPVQSRPHRSSEQLCDLDGRSARQNNARFQSCPVSFTRLPWASTYLYHSPNEEPAKGDDP